MLDGNQRLLQSRVQLRPVAYIATFTNQYEQLRLLRLLQTTNSSRSSAGVDHDVRIRSSTDLGAGLRDSVAPKGCELLQSQRFPGPEFSADLVGRSVAN